MTLLTITPAPTPLPDDADTALLERLARDRTRPLLQRDDREEVLRQLSTARAPLYAEVADMCFDTNGLGSSDAACQLGRLLVDRWQRNAAAA